MDKTLLPIPQPKIYGPLGNLPLIDINEPAFSLGKLAEEHGPIFRFQTPRSTNIIVTGHKIAADVFDEDRFEKSVKDELDNVRAFAGDGLFTSRMEEPNWQKAHNILFPTFSKTAMKGYHDMMVDIAMQLIQKWARLNPDESIDVPGDMTRLTLDTIGLCGFNYRFNSFYREEHSPFIQSMVRALNEAMYQNGRLDIQNKLMFRTKKKYKQDIQTMFSLVDKIIQERKARGDSGEADLLARMLNGKDPLTGEMLDDKNIRYQMITFLIAGHETTSGLLSFALYFMLKNPEVMKKAYQEVDEVLTDSIPVYEQIVKLKYLRMILDEALRLWPTAPGFSVYAKEDTIIGDKYLIKKGENIVVLLPQLHRDKEAWGEDAEQFFPERFTERHRIPSSAYKPFGNGQRACIGMQFAMHEATLVLGMILQNFELLDFDNYELDVVQTLTLKPGDFKIKVLTRNTKTLKNYTLSEEKMGLEMAAASVDLKEQVRSPIEGANQHSVLVLYGSDLGSAEAIARELAATAQLYGFQSEIASLNERTGNLPKDGAVLIVAASYNGHPSNNARTFVKWLKDANSDELKNIHYAVFGCGDQNWANTYQAVPRLIDEQLYQKGATRFSERGESDASGDAEKHFEDWTACMWKNMLKMFNLEFDEKVDENRNGLNIEFVHGMAGLPLVLENQAFSTEIVENRELQLAGSGRSTKHLEIDLPAGVTYQEGDHLGVLPKNSRTNINRILLRFSLNGDDSLILDATGRNLTHLPVGRPVSLFDILYYCVDVQGIATRAQIRTMASFTECPPHKRDLDDLLTEGIYEEQVLKKRISMLELLEKYPSCELSFGKFLELLPPLKPRYYSISSSPARQPQQASITVGVVRDKARSGNGEYRGVASNYLEECKPGEEIMMFIRTPQSGFQLPDNIETPIIMVGPGTGIAPFRGFLQARYELEQRGKSLGEAHLYFGCRNEKDFLYRDELELLESKEIVKLHTAYSRKQELPKTYVQDLIQQNTNEIIEILNQGGRLYVCGDGKHMVKSVEAALQRAYQDVEGVGEQEAIDWLINLQSTGIYAKDVWEG